MLVIIWGTVFYKIYNGVGTPDLTMPDSKPILLDEKPSMIRQKWALDLNYQDPFLKKVYVAEEEINELVQEAPKKVESPKDKEPEKIIWPSLIYKGYVDDRIFIDINSESFLMSLGEEQRGVVFEGFYQDSIALTFKDERKVFIQE